MAYFKVLQTQLKWKINLSKVWIRIKQYTLDDFQGWSKWLSRLKQSISVFLEVGYKILSQPYVELHRQA